MYESSRRAILGALTGVGLAASGALRVAASEEDDDLDRDGAEYDGTIDVQQVDEEEILRAITTDDFEGAVDGATYEGVDVQVETFEQEIQGFPLLDDAFTVLSSGLAEDAPGDPEEFASTDVEGRHIPNYSPDDFDAFNVAELRIDFTVPEGAEGIAFDYRFATEESPSWLDSQFQDFFEAALILPDGSATNIARLPDGSPVTVDNADEYANTPGGTSEEPEPPLPDPPDTVYNAVTDRQTAERGLGGFEGEQLRLVLRIADASDGLYDSAAFVDDLRFVGEVENPLEPVEDAFDRWRGTLPEATRGLVRAEARAEARLYAEHGDEFADPLVDMMGYLAGELSEEAVDEEYRTIVEDISPDTDESAAAERYDFYRELFGRVSPDDPVEESTETFFQYLLGVHDEQTNYLRFGGMTMEELIEHRLDEFDEYVDRFVSDLEEVDYSGAEIQRIASFVESKERYFRELLAESRRDETAVIENLTGDAEFDGRIVANEIEEEATADASPEALITAAAVTIALKAKGVSITGLAIKGGTTAYKGAKGSTVGKKVSGVASQYGIGGSAKLAWLESKASTAATWFHGQHWMAKLFVDEYLWGDAKKFVLGKADQGFDYLLGFPPQAKLDSFLYDVDIDEGLETEYVGPARCLNLALRSASIEDVTVSDIGVTDHFEGILPPFGRETGEVTVQNTSTVTFSPMLEVSLHQVDIQPMGTTKESPYPIVFTEPVPELAPGETETVEFEYAVPIGLFSSSYEVRVDLRHSDEHEAARFDAGATTILSSVRDLASGVLSDGESIRHEYQVDQGTKTATVGMEYSEFDADLHLYDEDGNHVGENYETGEFENQIEGALHSGHDDGALGDEWVTVDDPDPAYDVEIVVPEVETVVQGEAQSSVSPSSGGDVEYAVESTEVPELTGVLDMWTTSARVDDPDETAIVDLGVAERSEQDGVTDVTLSSTSFEMCSGEIPADNVTFGDQGFDVAAGGTVELTAAIEVPDDVERGVFTGEITATGDDGEATVTETTTVTVVGPAVGNYANEECVVDTEGLREAIDDWRTGAIGTDLLRDVIDAWRSEQPVT